jgi:hypothetical protein
MVTPARSCLHCALARALGDESTALAAAGLTVTLGRSDPVWLPVRGAVLYRGLRRLLRAAQAGATRGTLRLAVVDLTGKSHVEVTAAVPSGRGTRVLSHAFPRFDQSLLGHGFAEIGNVR